jgi:hypothetical protein
VGAEGAVVLIRSIPLVLLVLLLAACGGGGKSSAPPSNLTPIAYVKSAAIKTGQATSEHATLRGSVGAAGQAVTLSGAGDFDNTNRQGSMHLDFAVSGLSGTLDEVLDGSTIYLSSPLFSASLPQGKTWLKLDLQKAAASKGIDLSALLSQNPAQSLAQLQSSSSVTKVGDETIDGVATTHYRGRIDPSKRIKALAHAKYAPYDVWIGKDDGNVRRIMLSYSLPVPGGKPETIGLTMGFSDYGKDVIVTVPSAADSYDATNKAIQGLGG